MKLAWPLLLSTALASPVSSSERLPHFGVDLISGNLAHAQRHVAKDVLITTYRFGRKVNVSLAELIADTKGCKPVRYGKDTFLGAKDKIFVLNCGKPFDMDILTGGKIEGITSIEYFDEAVAAPPPPPSPTRGKL